MYIYSWKKIDKNWSILVMQLRKNGFFFCLARGLLLDNGVHPRASPPMCVFQMFNDNEGEMHYKTLP